MLLAALTAVLLTLLERPHDLASRGWFQPPSQVTLPADIIYRLSQALASKSFGDQSQLISAHQFETTALALYEQSALGGPPRSAQASYRLAIFYARSGYTDHAQELFLQASQLDEANRKLYLLLSHLYADEPADEASLRDGLALLEQQDRWLAELTRADLYERIGQVEHAAALRADWQQRQVLFASIVGALLLFYIAMSCLGAFILLVLLIAWLTKEARTKRRAVVAVPWTLVDVAEAVVVLTFLMVCLSIGTAVIRSLIAPAGQSETIDALLVAVSYALACAGAIALMIYRIGFTRPYWQLLGVRLHNIPRQLGQGVAGYAVFIGLLFVALLVLRLLGLDAFLPLAKAPTELLTEARSPATLAIYLVVVAVIAPVVEEIIFRGFVYPGLRRIMPVAPAALGSALIFAGVHVSAPVGGLVVIVLVGVVLACLYERTGSILPSMVAHSMYNSFVFTLLATYTLV